MKNSKVSGSISSFETDWWSGIRIILCYLFTFPVVVLLAAMGVIREAVYHL